MLGFKATRALAVLQSIVLVCAQLTKQPTAVPTAVSTAAPRSKRGPNQDYELKDPQGILKHSQIPRQTFTIEAGRFEVVFEDSQWIEPLTEYQVTCVMHPPEASYDGPARRLLSSHMGIWSAVNVTTKGSSGIAGDPHVRTLDGTHADLFGEEGVFQLYSSNNLSVRGRLEAATAGVRALFHPAAMKAGTLLTEAGVALGRLHVRLGLHAGGLVSISNAKMDTTFLSAGEDERINIGGAKLTWETVQEEKTFEWGNHTRSQKLTVKTSDVEVVLYISESGGYRFIDVDMLADAGGVGLLHDAMVQPEELRASLANGGDRLYQVSDGNLFAEASSALAF